LIQSQEKDEETSSDEFSFEEMDSINSTLGSEHSGSSITVQSSTITICRIVLADWDDSEEELMTKRFDSMRDSLIVVVDDLFAYMNTNGAEVPALSLTRIEM
jgi:hypothetical protein